MFLCFLLKSPPKIDKPQKSAAYFLAQMFHICMCRCKTICTDAFKKSSIHPSLDPSMFFRLSRAGSALRYLPFDSDPSLPLQTAATTTLLWQRNNNKKIRKIHNDGPQCQPNSWVRKTQLWVNMPSGKKKHVHSLAAQGEEKIK